MSSFRYVIVLWEWVDRAISWLDSKQNFCKYTPECLNKQSTNCKTNPLCTWKGQFQRIVLISGYYSSSNQLVSNYMDDGEQPILLATRFLGGIDMMITATLE